MRKRAITPLVLLSLGVVLGATGCSLQDFDRFEEPILPDGSDGNVRLTIRFEGDGDGTVRSVTPTGLECTGTCDGFFPWGTTVTLRPSEWTGSVFSGWSGACEGNEDCVLTLTEYTDVYATFDLEP